MAPYYPVSLRLSGLPCLVVGGGPVAARKARGLLAAGAAVTVIAPDVGAELAGLRTLAIARRPYAPGDARPFRLVVAATGDPAVDGAVFADAEAAGVWVNSVDDPDHCTVILPSVHRDGPVTVAVSTGGNSPALASWLRDRLARSGATGLGALAELLGRARGALRDGGIRTDTVDWVALLDGPLPALVAAGRMEEATALVETAIGAPLASG
ncbi:MAG: bifunctional precorrin-2 dehydrogenase/sirohydrochlorin ferrochelatase [Acidimicrobiales bacterium]